MKIKEASRIVIKIGSALVTTLKGELHKAWLESLAQDIADLKQQGKEVILVSSGSVALGRKRLIKDKITLTLGEKQAAAACGQVELMHAYSEIFQHHGIIIGQILLTITDSEDRKRYLNARTTLHTLLSMGAVPIVNENDTVAVAELRVGDNDRLAARVAQMVDADLLILLSDIDGLYTANPHIDKTAKFIPLVTEVTREIEAMAGGALTSVGSGGMATKIAAAKIAMARGCHMVISEGKTLYPIKRLIEGAKATWFISKENSSSARKQWIRGALSPMGKIIIDDGAVTALKKGGSLLPAGVKAIKGWFDKGDTVSVFDLAGSEIARGLIAYSVEEAERIMGKKSSEIETILGFSGQDALIHRNDLVMM